MGESEMSNLLKYKDIVHKELDLIQDVIKRMASNSFQVKAWLAGIVSFLLAFEREKLFSDPRLILAIWVPVAAFWYLDAFFLQAERKYRNLYNSVIIKRAAGDYSNLYDLKPVSKVEILNSATGKIRSEEVPSIWDIMWTKTLWPFYLLPLILTLLGLVILS